MERLEKLKVLIIRTLCLFRHETVEESEIYIGWIFEISDVE